MERIIRPEMSVLPDSALVPDEVASRPLSVAFTHVLTMDQEYYGHDANGCPDGVFLMGAKVQLLSHNPGDKLCRVVDENGVCAATPFAGLRPIDGEQGLAEL